MPPETDNLRLQELYNADQADRSKVFDSAEAVKQLRLQDAMRRQLVLEMAARGEINTGNDLYHAAVILLHGHEAKDFLTAHRYASMASINGHKPSRWLAAASLDRFLMAVGLPQVYGTQFEHNEDEGKYQLRLPIDDSHILGYEKKFFNVPSVMDRLAQLNGKSKAR